MDRQKETRREKMLRRFWDSLTFVTFLIRTDKPFLSASMQELSEAIRSEGIKGNDPEPKDDGGLMIDRVEHY